MYIEKEEKILEEFKNIRNLKEVNEKARKLLEEEIIDVISTVSNKKWKKREEKIYTFRIFYFEEKLLLKDVSDEDSKKYDIYILYISSIFKSFSILMIVCYE